jgi:tetratricopeptide (TPR) repeat protein
MTEQPVAPDVAEPESEPVPMYALESDTPLYSSMVWRLQRTFYGDQGIAAWSHSRVPQAITTSPNITRAYARMVLGFWRDLRAVLDPSEPLYIVELGAGSGRFAFRFLKAITQLTRDSDEPPPRFKYVMTDAIPSVVNFWRDNPRLRQFVDSGVLDFAHFDLAAQAPIDLQTTGVTLRPGEVVNPIVVFTNYIFDTIPQDAYTIHDGALHENLVTVSASSPELDLTAPSSRVRVSVAFKQNPRALDIEAEADPLLRDILRSYAERLNETTVVIPRAALATVRFFNELAGGRALCVAADIGDAHEEDLRDHGTPGFGAGGGLWLSVNFHAIGEYARRLGGRARHPRGQNLVLNISMLLFGPPGSSFSNTELAYSDTIDVHGPDEIALLSRALAEHMPSLKFEELLALMRATGWDPDYVSRSVPVLMEAVTTAEERLRRELLRGVHLAWDHYYPIGETYDTPFSLGVLLYRLEQYAEALEFFELSLHDFGEDPRTVLNKALTLYHLQRWEESLVWLDRTLELDPENELAQKMRPDVAADLAARNSTAL